MPVSQRLNSLSKVKSGSGKAIKRMRTLWHLWFMCVILATQEAEIMRVTVQSQPRQIVLKTLYQKIPTQNRLAE
jgi:hypothetical protein